VAEPTKFDETVIDCQPSASFKRFIDIFRLTCTFCEFLAIFQNFTGSSFFYVADRTKFDISNRKNDSEFLLVSNYVVTVSQTVVMLIDLCH
jgi:hypothetical protein